MRSPAAQSTKHHASFVRRGFRFRGALLGVAVGGALTLGASSAAAQDDLSPPLPDALLLVDTSGSMEYKVGSTQFPTCDPTGSTTSEKSRWVELVEVLTGTIQNYRCQSVDRTSTTFRDGEYGRGGPLSNTISPYDYLYESPYHRPMSNDCVIGPGTLSSNAFDFPNSALKYHPYNNVSGSCSLPFSQAQDGVLDSFQYMMRFGLMTFDPLVGAGTGYAGLTTPDYASGIEGTWSYIWGNASTGEPLGCTSPQAFEVGARNAAAPPWEGRLVPFGDPSTGSTEYLSKRTQIEKVLLATRPYGPTPIAGLLKDASDFLTQDTSKDPMNSANDFGPYKDPYVMDPVTPGGCRSRFIILLSDGQPNMDLRPDCADNAGDPKCPFKKPEDIALALRSANPPIETYVVGFALSEFNVKGRGQVTCNDLSDSDFDTNQPSGLCNSTDPDNLANSALQACCTLNRIAVAGGSGVSPRAYFADNREDLARALTQILNSKAAVTTRSPPGIGGAAGDSRGFRFFPSVEPTSGGMWTGVLRRQRFTCQNGVATGIEPDKNAQDWFEANLNEHPADRYFASVRAGNGSEAIVSGRTIRPYYTQSGNPDGGGVYVGARYMGKQQTFVSSTSADMIAVDDTTCTSPALTASACRDRYLNWLVGLPNGTVESRCDSKGVCSLFGDILHSTPRAVGAPSDFVRDESYERFASANIKRPMVLYTSTNDGFLHAFEVAPTDRNDKDTITGPGTRNNELWAFVPPAILPHLRKQYPGTHQTLLDGVPIVKDVVATIPTDPDDADGIRFERTRADAQNGNGGWRTVLLQSFGTQSPAGGGYFALDVTNPLLSSSQLTDNSFGPRFLWQLTTDNEGRALFGRSADPVIATLFFDATGGDDPRQIPVAILPGGGGSQGNLGGNNTGCPSSDRSFSGLVESRFPPRARVRCYATEDLPGRSLTIVRLDTGEIVRTFRQSASEIADSDLAKLVTTAEIDSPITGRPTAFPADTGAISDRAYVGDQDGRLWKVDFSATKPADWTMKLFFDAFPQKDANSGSWSSGPGDGQPIVLPPVVSVDDKGDITVNVATGDQDTIGASDTMVNYIWSLTERTSSDRQTSVTHVNWYMPLTKGERVVGPMSLFNSQLFFTSIAPRSTADVSQHACALPTGQVWGMNYIVPFDKNDLSKGGEAALPVPNQTDKVRFASAATITGSSNAAMFGIAVTQVPTCVDSGTSVGDDFLGYSAEQTIRNVSAGQFQLVMTYRDGSKPAGGTNVSVKAVDLPAPVSGSRLDSWAALLE